MEEADYGSLLCCSDCKHYWSLHEHDRDAGVSRCTVPFCGCWWAP